MTTYADPMLPIADLIEPDYEPSMTLAERFDLFHSQNPHVADALEALAEQWLARHSRVGMKALVERLRWEAGIQTVGEPWRINNTHVAFYARLLIARRPEWADAIVTRRAQADDSRLT